MSLAHAGSRFISVVNNPPFCFCLRFYILDVHCSWPDLAGLDSGLSPSIWGYLPPYWDIITYSDNPRDLSNCTTLNEFELRLSGSVERLLRAVKPNGIMAILIGDKRRTGNYYVLMRTLLMNRNIGQLKGIIIKIQHNCRSDRMLYNSQNPFLIPIKHEYCLIFQK